MNDIPQLDFPPIFVDYAKEKLKKERDLVEYLARFGPPFLKGGAQMILMAAGEKLQESHGTKAILPLPVPS